MTLTSFTTILLHTGKKDAAGSSSSTAIVSVDVGSDGKVNFDAIVKQGANQNKIVFSKLSDIKVSLLHMIHGFTRRKKG